jgi:very-short-patch-repair endonuclease
VTLLEKIWTYARALRDSATDAEHRLWRHLRSRQVAGLKFRRQFPVAGFIADFACVEAKLIIELDGGQHAECTVQDEARSEKMRANGYRVVRFWNDDVLLRTDVVLEVIWREAGAERHPTPTPPLQAGEGLQGDKS